MASSMTGFGVGEARVDTKTITVELRSVNNRFLEVSCRLPSSLSTYEQKVRETIRQAIDRGKLYTTITIQDEANNGMDLRINRDAVKTVYALLNNLKETAGIQEQVTLDHVLKFSEVFEGATVENETDQLWEGVQEALNMALDNLKIMRQEEGAIIAKDMVERVNVIDAHVDRVETIAKSQIPETFDKLKERIQKLIADAPVDSDRLESEIALIADKLDVTEECVRLRCHDQLFLQTIEEKEVVGKKLNFLLQEMNRESNTISSKASNSEISHLVVEMKEEIEKLREQVQNLE